jgi:hypothetical protein
MNRYLDNPDYDNDSLNYSAEFRNEIDYQTNKRRSNTTYKINIAILIVSIASLIVGLIALFR